MNTFRTFIIGGIYACLLGVAPLAFAYVASSSNYRIQTDSMNAGGEFSTSTSYRIEDTLGEVGAGNSGSATYQIKAGYQQMQDTYLAVSIGGNVSLAPNIPSFGGGVANGSTAWTITTDNAAGYTANIRASTSPALASGGNNFPDYVPSGANPDPSFITPVAQSRFGFSPEGSDIVSTFRDNGITCNVGALDTPNMCWVGLSTLPITIATRVSGNHPTGVVTTVRFRAESEATNVQPSGVYSATATLTILAL